MSKMWTRTSKQEKETVGNCDDAGRRQSVAMKQEQYATREKRKHSENGLGN